MIAGKWHDVSIEQNSAVEKKDFDIWAQCIQWAMQCSVDVMWYDVMGVWVLSDIWAPETWEEFDIWAHAVLLWSSGRRCYVIWYDGSKPPVAVGGLWYLSSCSVGRNLISELQQLVGVGGIWYLNSCSSWEEFDIWAPVMLGGIWYLSSCSLWEWERPVNNSASCLSGVGWSILKKLEAATLLIGFSDHQNIWLEQSSNFYVVEY